MIARAEIARLALDAMKDADKAMNSAKSYAAASYSSSQSKAETWTRVAEGHSRCAQNYLKLLELTGVDPE